MRSELLVLFVAALATFSPRPASGEPTSDGTISFAAPEYHAHGDGVHDDTAALSAAVRDATVQKRRLICPSGATYLVSRQGMTALAFDGHDHPRVFKISGPLVLDGHGCTIKVAVDDNSTTNVFWFENTSHVRISGVRFEGIGSAGTRMPLVNGQRVLYAGAAIVFNRCDDCWADDIQSTNMRGNTLLFESFDSGVRNSFSSIPIGSQAGCHFCLYSSSGGLIDNVTVYGASADGDIFALGRPLRTVAVAANVIRNSRAYNLASGDRARAINITVNGGGQAFGCDAQQSNCTIEGSYAYGYYFSFDCKGGSVGCNLTNNVAERTKIGFSCRPGEAPALATYQCVIANNKVFPAGGTGNPNNTDYFRGATSEACFFLHNAYNARLEGNTCEAVGAQPGVNAGDNFVGLMVVMDGATEPGLTGGVEAANNTFVMSQKVAGGATVTSSNYAIYARGYGARFPYMKVSGGTIKRQGEAKPQSAIDIENADNVSIHGVTIDQGTAGAVAITLRDVGNALIANNLVPTGDVFLRAVNSAVVNVTGNVVGGSGPTIDSAGSKNWTIANNTRVSLAAGGMFFRAADADACPRSAESIVFSGNNVQSKTPLAALTRICGVDDYRGAGVVASGNIVNGSSWDSRTK